MVAGGGAVEAGLQPPASLFDDRRTVVDRFVRHLSWLFRAVVWCVRAAVVVAVVAVTVGLAAVALLPRSFDARAMVVTSGSMEPTIGVGSLAVVESVDPHDIAVGHVISFHGYGTDALTTHRVLARRVVNGRLHFQTKGDANDATDVDLAPGEGVVGRVRMDVPYAGRALAELQRPQLRLLLLGAPSLWFFAAHLLRLWRALRTRRRAGAPSVTGSMPVAVVVVVALVALAVPGRAPAATSAGFVDAATVGQNAFWTGTW